jgi:hypothetical protein
MELSDTKKLDLKDRVEVKGKLLILKDLTLEERYVISTAISCQRTQEVSDDTRNFYCLTWEKDLALDSSMQDILFTGLDNYVCDTGGVIYAVEDGDYQGEPTIDMDQIKRLNTIARGIYKILEQVEDTEENDD